VILWISWATKMKMRVVAVKLRTGLSSIKIRISEKEFRIKLWIKIVCDFILFLLCSYKVLFGLHNFALDFYYQLSLSLAVSLFLSLSCCLFVSLSLSVCLFVCLSLSPISPQLFISLYLFRYLLAAERANHFWLDKDLHYINSSITEKKLMHYLVFGIILVEFLSNMIGYRKYLT
jgi:hypothetical protein